MEKVKKLTDALRILIKGEFTGYVKINFTQGSIGRVEKYEEFCDAANIRAIDKHCRTDEEELQDGQR